MAILFLMSTFGLLMVYQIQQIHVRKEVKQALKLGVDENELFTFHIPHDARMAKEQGFTWMRPQKEFKYGNGMYDVIRKTRGDSTTTFVCISDEKEAAIFTQLERLVAIGITNNPTQQQQRGVYFQFMKNLMFNDTNAIMLQIPTCMLQQMKKYLPLVSSQHLAVVDFPPEYHC